MIYIYKKWLIDDLNKNVNLHDILILVFYYWLLLKDFYTYL